MPVPLDPAVAAFLDVMRVGRLATVGVDGAPLVLPICFAVRDRQLFIALDEKPKSRDPLDLERVRNLQSHPQAAVVVDRWDEDWTRLAWVHLRGPARIVPPGGSSQNLALHREALVLLRAKYEQYGAMNLEERPLIVLEIERVKAWGALGDTPARGTP